MKNILKKKIITIFKKYYIHDIKTGRKYFTQRTILGFFKFFIRKIINNKYLTLKKY